MDDPIPRQPQVTAAESWHLHKCPCCSEMRSHNDPDCTLPQETQCRLCEEWKGCSD